MINFFLIGIFVVFLVVTVIFMQPGKVKLPIRNVVHLNTIEQLDNPYLLELDTYYIRQMYKEVFEYIEELKNRGETSEIITIYIRLLDGVSNKEVVIFIREILELCITKDIKKTIESDIFTHEEKVYLKKELKKLLLVTKKPLVDYIKNDYVSMIYKSKQKLVDSNLTTSQINAGKYMYDYALKLNQEDITIEVDAIKTGIFKKFNIYKLKQVKKYVSKEAIASYENSFLALSKKNLNIATKLYLEHEAEKLIYVPLEHFDLEHIYNVYMFHISKNKKLLKMLK